MDRTIRNLNLQSMQKKITISIHTTFCEKVGSKSKRSPCPHFTNGKESKESNNNIS